jgi:hypothetical protein
MDNTLVCPACGKEVDKLVTHHWYELPDLTIHSKDICSSCNGLLVTSNFYGIKYYLEHKNSLHHILPSWNEQLNFIQQALRQQQKIVHRIKPINRSRVTLSVANHHIAITKESYDLITYLKVEYNHAYTYDDIIKDLLNCYINTHRINLSDELKTKLNSKSTIIKTPDKGGVVT